MNPKASSPLVATALSGDLRDVDNHARSVFVQSSARFAHHRSAYVPGAHHPADMVPGTATIVYSLQNQATACVVFEDHGMAALIRHDGSGSLIRVAAGSMSAATRALDALTVRLEPEVDDTMTATFWQHDGTGGGAAWVRRLDTCGWPEVQHNYPPKVRAHLEQVIPLSSMPAGGRILLWTGAPGTGKTHAIRALLHEWRNWCRPHIVIDPEHFFGSADYMTHVLQSASARNGNRRPRLSSAIPAGEPEPTTEPWSLIVCEDADDFIHTDARARVGGGMGRLLNMTDGLVGQGLNVAVLLTSNLPPSRIDRALQRPGRCLSATDFQPFTPLEAEHWLGRQPPTTGDKYTLAELYTHRGDTTHHHSNDDAVSGIGGYL